jgi:hypothetical protein
MAATMTRKTLRGTDWTGQRRARISALSDDVTIGEVVEELVQALHLPPNTPYAARVAEQKLNKTDTLGDLDLADEAELVIAPEVSAG